MFEYHFFDQRNALVLLEGSRLEIRNPTSPFGASSGLEALFPHFPHPQCPFGERRTSPLPLSVVLSPRVPDLRGPPLAAQSPSRSDPKIHQNFNWIFVSFWWHFGSQHGSQNHLKSAPGRRHPGVLGQDLGVLI